MPRLNFPTKICKICTTEKVAGDFYKVTGRVCKLCHNKRSNQYIRNNRDKWYASVLSTSLKKYGLTPEAYATLLEQQKGVCALCEKPPLLTERLSVDHCHKTGKIRGLLHSKCNLLIAMAEDTIVTLEQAISYLRKI